MTRNIQTFTLLALCIFFLAAVLFFINPRFPLDISLFIFAALLIFAVSLLNTDAALIILIFSMLLSPELKIGAAASRNVVIRIEDMLLFVVFFGWFAKMALHKDLGLLRTTALNRPIFFYMFICVLPTLWAVFNGQLNMKNSFFYLVKYFEYFLLYFMVVNNLDSMKKVKLFVFFLLLTCLLVSLYGWIQIPGGERVSTPFEGTEGEPNTFAGYMILMMGVTMGLLSYLPRYRMLLTGFLCVIFVPFVYTLSRGSWVAFFPMLLCLIFFTRRFRTPFIIVLLLSIVILVSAPYLLPKRVHHRIQETFTAGKTYELMGNRITLDESTSVRIESWKEGFAKVIKRPFLGYGVPDAAIVDNQYIRVLRETGIIGFFIFLWLLVSLFHLVYHTYQETSGNDFAQGLSLGFLAGFVGILMHGMSAATFIIIRIMEPFWFLAAIVAILPEVVSPSAAEEQGEL